MRGLLQRLFTRHAAPAGGEPSASESVASLEAALEDARAHYAELRAAAASCLYVVHKLGGEAARQARVADAIEADAGDALLERDLARSKRLLLRAHAARELGREADAHRRQLRTRAEATLDALRSLGHQLARMERARLLAHTRRVSPSAESLARARHALDVLEAERALERELGVP